MIEITPQPAAQDHCDFCGSPDVITVFKTRPGYFEVHYFPNVSVYHDDGEWAACAPCAVCVRTGQQQALRSRSLTADKVPPEQLEGFTLFVQEMHGIFWNNLIGESDTEL